MDYIFAFVLISGFFGILFAFSFTLSVASLTQYITFAASRAYTAGHISPSDQERLSVAKYQELINHKSMKPLYKSGWFKIQKTPDIGHISKSRFPDKVEDPDTDLFWGVGTNFDAQLLDFRIPFYGSTTSTGTSENSGFNTFIASYLGREVSAKECKNFVTRRFTEIKNLNSRYNNVGGNLNAYADYCRQWLLKKNYWFIKINQQIKSRIKLKIQKKQKGQFKLSSNKGMATIESLPLLSIFLVILSYQLGLFGIIHSSILHSISARTFAFETFRNRTSLTYYRENGDKAISNPHHYQKSQIRWHSIVKSLRTSARFHVTKRPISTSFLGRGSSRILGNQQDHNERIYNLKERNRQVEVNPAWIMVGYGMCLNVECGGDPQE